jgi:uncharacterized membrane protein YczE
MPRPSLWRPGPLRLALLLVGLWLFGTGDACIVAAELGNSPWTVLAEGVSKHTPLAIGTATIAISGLVMLAWIPLRQRPGIGTLANAVVIGLAIDVMLPLLPGPGGIAARYAFVAFGTAFVGLGSGLYLTARLGPGPRDGLMTGLHFRTGRSLRLIRTLIEGSALVSGALLGGRVGVGTVAVRAAGGPGGAGRCEGAGRPGTAPRADPVLERKRPGQNRVEKKCG